MNTLLRSRLPKILLVLAIPIPLFVSGGPPAAAAPGTTAWQNGNGALGAAVWSAGGFTAQLNRTDTQQLVVDVTGADPNTSQTAQVKLWSGRTPTLVRNGDGTVSFRAQVKNKLVCAENAGAAPLIANRDAIGPWEQFDLVEGETP